ncbi:competence type IV pilus minor pilin ComGG [Streptococcus dentiloxodontae]
MLLKKRLRGGILLYAILMAGLFSLLLQVYLDRSVAMERQSQAQLQASQSQLMAKMTLEMADAKSGQLSFSQGKSSYQKKDEFISVTVVMNNGQSYTYQYLTEGGR